MSTDPTTTPASTSTPRPRARVIGARASGPACHRHADRVAEYRCSECSTYHCVECARLAEFGGVTRRVCACSGACDTLEDRMHVRARPRFSRQLVDALAWPVSRAALPTLLIGAFVYGFLAFLTRGGTFAVLAPIGWALGCAATGYAIEFGFQILARTARGDDDLPDWPDATDVWDNFVRPLLLVIGLAAVCAAPAAVVMLLTGGTWWLAAPFAVFGYLAFTLACASLALGGGIEELHPRQLLGLWRNNEKATLETMLALLVLAITHLSIQGILLVLGKVSLFFPCLLGSFASLYAIVLGARWLGLMLRERAAREIDSLP